MKKLVCCAKNLLGCRWYWSKGSRYKTVQSFLSQLEHLLTSKCSMVKLIGVNSRRRVSLTWEYINQIWKNIFEYLGTILRCMTPNFLFDPRGILNLQNLHLGTYFGRFWSHHHMSLSKNRNLSKFEFLKRIMNSDLTNWSFFLNQDSLARCKLQIFQLAR